MGSRTWPALHLAFEFPSDTERRDALLLDIDDCGASAMEESSDTVSLFFTSPETRDAAHALLRERGWEAYAELSTDDLPDEGWAARSQEHLPAVQVGRIVVTPPWELACVEADADPTHARIVIVVEPSTGFGTGHHQSTRLCLRALQAIDVEGRRVLDIGTGSGVLAIAAWRLGAADVLGIDNDPDALESAEDTLARNANAPPGVGAGRVRREPMATLPVGQVRPLHPAERDAIRFELRGLNDTTLERADVVCANLTGTLLRQQGARVQALIAPGGCAVLSGFTEDEARWVREAFDACDVEAAYVEECWIAYVMRRRAASQA